MNGDFEERLSFHDEGAPLCAKNRTEPRGFFREGGSRPDRQREGEARGSRAASRRRLLFALVLLVGGCAQPAPTPLGSSGPEAPPPASASAVPPAAVRTPAPPPPSGCDRIARIEIRKADRTLVADCANGAIFTAPIALGREPEGAKDQMGDMRTPEGLYHIVGPRQRSRFHGFIPVDYPSVTDAERAVTAQRLSREDYRRIVDAHRRGALPPSDTPLGGWIGIHGQGERWREYSLELDWTFGCVAVSDGDLDFLADRVETGVPVEILP